MGKANGQDILITRRQQWDRAGGSTGIRQRGRACRHLRLE